MPLWLICALLSPFFWAIVFVLDSYCVEEVFTEPWLGGVTSAISMALLFPLMLGGLLITGFQPFHPTGLLLAASGGLFHMVSQFCYFKALNDCESGIVSAYWNMTPLIIPILGFLFLGEKLTLAQYGGIAGMIICSVLFCMLDYSKSTRWSTFLLMSIASACEAVYFILIKQALFTCPSYPTLLASTATMILSGFSPLCLPTARRTFLTGLSQLRKALPILIFIEIANLIAVGMNQYAINDGSPSLVAAVEATLPAYCFLLSMALWALFRKFGEEEAKRQLPPKLVLATGMAAFVWLLA